MEEREPNDAERAERAERLRREVERLTGDEESERPPRSPHEFVEERMREDEESDPNEDDEEEGRS